MASVMISIESPDKSDQYYRFESARKRLSIAAPRRIFYRIRLAVRIRLIERTQLGQLLAQPQARQSKHTNTAQRANQDAER